VPGANDHSPPSLQLKETQWLNELNSLSVWLDNLLPEFLRTPEWSGFHMLCSQSLW